MYTPETLRTHLVEHLHAKYGQQRGFIKAASYALGITQATLSQAIHGRRGPPPAILEELGLKRVVMYVPKESK